MGVRRRGRLDLTFYTWVTWAGNFPPGTVGQDAVVHLISEDIYIDIRFESWSCCGAGGFSYVRSTRGECFTVTDQSIDCHADGSTFTYTVQGTDQCTGGSSSYVFTTSGGAVGEQMCFTLLVSPGGGFCCTTELCITVPDCAEPITPGDIDRDNLVGITDLLALLASWGPCSDCSSCGADLDGDCDVGIGDLLVLLANWS